MTDDRISRYLHDQADAIELRPSTPASVVQRARRRRRHRRTTVMAVAAVTLGASTVVATRGDDGPAELSVQSTAVTPTALEWSVVETTSGLGSDRDGGSVVSADGAVYSLSTAPGPYDPAALSAPATLYRSTDGAEWSPVGMPDDFWPTSLAGQGSRIYSVGTAPAGGAVTYRLASSDDGGSTWTTAEIPSDVVALMERYPDEVTAMAPTVAVHDGTVVVSGFVSAYLDVAARIPGLDPLSTWTITDDGVEVGPLACAVPDGATDGRVVVTQPPSAEPAPPPADTSSPTTVTVPPTGDGSSPTTVTVPPTGDGSSPTTVTVPPSGDGSSPTTVTVPPTGDGSSPTTVTVPPSESGADPMAAMACEITENGDVTTYTWADLGVDDELRDLVTTGRSYVYVSQDGGEFALADAGGSTGGRAQVVAADDGFTLFVGRYADGGFTTDVVRSADGAVWEPAGELAGEVVEAGVVAGRPAAAVVAGDDFAKTVRLAQADGSWLTVDPRTALDEPADAAVSQVAFGPLGWAATLWGEGAGTVAVHSVDGASMSVVPLDDVLDLPPGASLSLEAAVTADAVLVRATDIAADDDPATVPPQRVVVGTPQG